MTVVTLDDFPACFVGPVSARRPDTHFRLGEMLEPYEVTPIAGGLAASLFFLLGAWVGWHMGRG